MKKIDSIAKNTKVHFKLKQEDNLDKKQLQTHYNLHEKVISCSICGMYLYDILPSNLCPDCDSRK